MERRSSLDEARCGIFNYRPDCLQKFNNMKMFAAIVSCYTLFGTLCFSYYSAVIYQIEKAYGLSSSVTGFLRNVDNIGYMLTVICVGHFCRYINKPIAFFVAGICSSTSILLFAMPHFVYPPATLDDHHTKNFSSHYNVSADDKYLCKETDGTQQSDMCEGMNSLRSANIGALAMFMASEFAQGVSNTPKYSLSVTYIDDNTKKSSPIYYSFILSTRSIAPVFGFCLGAWTSGIYVDMTEQDFDSKDPRWIGCWWLGFVICGALSLLPAFPMICFPSEIKSNNHKPIELDNRTADSNERDCLNNQTAMQPEENARTVLEQVRDFPAAILRIVKNPVYDLLILSVCIEIQMIGFAIFLPKYLQIYYQLTPSMASIVTGVTITIPFTLGPLLSGQILARVRPTVQWTLRYMVITSVLGTASFLAASLITCDQQTWNTDISDSSSLHTGCNNNCSCTTDLFLPVCDETTNTHYYSPCFAGCLTTTGSSTRVGRDSGDVVYADCTCVPSGSVTLGMCNNQCNMLPVYMVFYALSLFFVSMDFVPRITCVTRLAGERDKALAISTFLALAMAAGFPGPLFFGMVIDSACIVYQSICGDTGACLQYNTRTYHTRVHTLGVCVKCVALCVLCASWCVSMRGAAPVEQAVRTRNNDVHAHGEDHGKPEGMHQHGEDHGKPEGMHQHGEDHGKPEGMHQLMKETKCT